MNALSSWSSGTGEAQFRLFDVLDGSFTLDLCWSYRTILSASHWKVALHRWSQRNRHDC